MNSLVEEKKTKKRPNSVLFYWAKKKEPSLKIKIVKMKVFG